MIRRSTIIFALASLIAFGSLLLYAHRLSEKAQQLVRVSYELSERKQPPTVADIKERFGNRIKQAECNGSECEYTVFLSNRVLAALHIVPYTQMESQFWTKDRVVLMNMVNYTTTTDNRHSVVSHVQIDFCEGCRTFAIHPWDAASPKDTNGIIQIGNEASAQSRRTVLALNTGCLTKFGGCESIADLLPTVWKQTADKKIVCAVENDRGFVQKPANWP